MNPKIRMTWVLNKNYSSLNVDKSICQIKKIKVTVLNMNVTYYPILNPTKRAKSKTSHYSPTLQGCMNNRSGRAGFENFRIMLNSASSSTILIVKLTSKIKWKERAETNWETEHRNFITSKRVKIDFCLPDFSATKIVTWKCHVEKSTKGRYNMILGRDLLISLGLDLKFSENVIIFIEGPYEWCL